jgi:release factor glutamine methyltransferase
LLDANVLLGASLGIDPARVPLLDDVPVPPAAARRFQRMLARRLRREPVAYITGEKDFAGLRFEVSRAVLVPRPETELLVECAQRLIGELHPRRLIDVGTGCGAVAIALTHSHPTLRATGTDTSADALAVARRNAYAHGVGSRMNLVRCDTVRGLRVCQALVVANLPYIPSGAIDGLAPEVARWEPRGALDGGPDGLDVIRRLFRRLRLEPPLACLLEIDADQRVAVTALGVNAGLRATGCYLDLAGRPRVLEFRSEPVRESRC